MARVRRRGDSDSGAMKMGLTRPFFTSVKRCNKNQELTTRPIFFNLDRYDRLRTGIPERTYETDIGRSRKSLQHFRVWNKSQAARDTQVRHTSAFADLYLVVTRSPTTFLLIFLSFSHIGFKRRGTAFPAHISPTQAVSDQLRSTV